MATDQTNITVTMAQIAAGVASMVVKTVAIDSAENNQRVQNMGPKMGDPLM